MKKAISILLSLCFLLMLTGCSGAKQSAGEPSLTPVPFLPDVAQILEETLQDADQSTPAPPESAPAPDGSTPADSYARYADVKSKAFDRISAKLEGHDELYLSVGMAMLPVVMIDLSLLPLSIIGVEGGEAALSMLGIKDVVVNQAGGGYDLSYQDEEGRRIGLTCEFDAASDSMRSVSTRDGQEILFFEYTRAGESYASQYYVWDDNTGDYSWITAFFDANTIAAFGVATVAEKQKSIFKGSGLNTDFVINEDGYYILDGDELTVLSNGEVKTY